MGGNSIIDNQKDIVEHHIPIFHSCLQEEIEMKVRDQMINAIGPRNMRHVRGMSIVEALRNRLPADE